MGVVSVCDGVGEAEPVEFDGGGEGGGDGGVEVCVPGGFGGWDGEAEVGVKGMDYHYADKAQRTTLVHVKVRRKQLQIRRK